MDGESSPIEILTGPNSSGKSVYLKQIALIAYLTQIGCFVPAERASLCLFHSIHTKFNTIERLGSLSLRFVASPTSIPPSLKISLALAGSTKPFQSVLLC